MVEFNIHCSFNVFIEENVIVAQLFDAFNCEAAEAYVESFDDAIFSLSGQKCFIVLDLRLVEGATPEAWGLAEKHNKALALDDNLLAKAILSNAMLVRHMGEVANKSISSNKVSSFRQMSEAKAWLIEKGLNTSINYIEENLN
jgi:hypothetical protein